MYLFLSYELLTNVKRCTSTFLSRLADNCIRTFFFSFLITRYEWSVRCSLPLIKWYVYVCAPPVTKRIPFKRKFNWKLTQSNNYFDDNNAGWPKVKLTTALVCGEKVFFFDYRSLHAVSGSIANGRLGKERGRGRQYGIFNWISMWCGVDCEIIFNVHRPSYKLSMMQKWPIFILIFNRLGLAFEIKIYSKSITVEWMFDVVWMCRRCWFIQMPPNVHETNERMESIEYI